MYRPVGANQKDVSTRLMKPTRPEIRVKQVLRLVRNWNSTWDYGGEVTVSIVLPFRNQPFSSN